MKKTMLTVLLLLAPAFGQESPQGQSAETPTAAGCGSNKVKFDVMTDKHRHPTAQPQMGKAIVYVIGDFGSSAHLTTRVGLDGAWVGANHSQSYFSFPVEPGDHRLCANWQSHFNTSSRIGSAASFTAEAGKTYYFRAVVDEKSSGMALEPVDPAKGQYLVSTFALSTSQPRKRMK